MVVVRAGFPPSWKTWKIRSLEISFCPKMYMELWVNLVWNFKFRKNSGEKSGKSLGKVWEKSRNIFKFSSQQLQRISDFLGKVNKHWHQMNTDNQSGKSQEIPII